MSGIYKLGPQYKPTADLNDFVGEIGDLFFNPNDPYIRISDGSTPGGVRVVPDLSAAEDGQTLVYNATSNSFEGRHISRTVQLFQDGLLEDTEGTVRWYAPAAIRVESITMRIGDVSDVDVQIDVKKNGNAQESVILSAGDQKKTKTVSFTMAVDDFLTVDLSCPSNTIGTRLSVEFSYTFT